MSNFTRLLASSFLCILTFTVFAKDIANSSSRVTNRLGEVTSNIKDLPIERLTDVLTPKGWDVMYTSDELRNHLVHFDKGQKWHEALEQVGLENHIVFLVDGAHKKVIAHLPGIGRLPGVEIINSRSVVFNEDPRTQDILKRSEINEVNWRRKQLQEEIMLNQERKVQLAKTLDDLEIQKQDIERQSMQLEAKTANAIKTAQNDGKAHSYVVSKVNANNAKPRFVFYVNEGLVFGNNVYRLAKQIGFDTVTVDAIVPQSCDWPQTYDYTISDVDPLQGFTDYITPYGFDVSFHKVSKEVYLKFVGDASQFMECK
jgi:hypothetical protein